MVRRLSEAMSAALIGSKFSPIPSKISFLVFFTVLEDQEEQDSSNEQEEEKEEEPQQQPRRRRVTAFFRKSFWSSCILIPCTTSLPGVLVKLESLHCISTLNGVMQLYCAAAAGSACLAARRLCLLFSPARFRAARMHFTGYCTPYLTPASSGN